MHENGASTSTPQQLFFVLPLDFCLESDFLLVGRTISPPGQCVSYFCKTAMFEGLGLQSQGHSALLPTMPACPETLMLTPLTYISLGDGRRDGVVQDPLNTAYSEASGI